MHTIHNVGIDIGTTCSLTALQLDMLLFTFMLRLATNDALQCASHI